MKPTISDERMQKLAWVKRTKGLSSKREILIMANFLAVDRRMVAGVFMDWIDWADEETTDGFIDGMTVDQIDTVVNYENFGRALLLVDWIKEDNRGLYIVNFDRHNGESAKKRALDQRRQAVMRERKKREKTHVTQ